MKKFLALMFVCAGLTAMAVTPQVNNVKVMQGKPNKAMVNKAAMPQNKMMTKDQANKLMTDYSKSLPGFFAQHNLTPNDNQLLKKAPRRVSEDALLASSPLFSAITYAYDSQGDSLAMTYPVFTGGWNIDVAKGENENEYNYFAWYTQIPNVVTIDLANNTAEMQAGVMAGWHWADTTSQGNNAYVINDTIEYVLLLDAKSVLNGTDEANIPGVVYDDGSIHFTEPWCIYAIDFVTKTTHNPRTGDSVEQDTVEGLVTDFLGDTWFMTPNGVHSYTLASTPDATTPMSATPFSNDVYMFQDSTTAYVWNLWNAFGFGYRNSEFTLDEEAGTVAFAPQPIAYEDIPGQYAEQYPNYTFGDTFFAFGYDPASDQILEDDVQGTVTNETLEWGENIFYSLFQYNNATYFAVGWPYHAYENKLTWKSEYDFWMLGKTADPVISSEVGDEFVTINCTVEDGAAYIMVVDGVQVESPYQVERGTEDKTVTVLALAQAYGKHESEIVQVEVLIPAKEDEYLRGDVNNDHEVNISDAIALISAVLNESWDDVNMDNADVNYSGSVDISDAIALINYVANSAWYDE